MLTEEQINRLEFEKLRKEMIANIEAVEIGTDHEEVLVITTKSMRCENPECGKMHKNLVVLSRGSIAFTDKCLRALAEKNILKILGLDDENTFGDPDKH